MRAKGSSAYTYGFEKLMREKLSEIGKMETSTIQQCIDELIKLGAFHKNIKIHRTKDTTTTEVYDKMSLVGYTVKRVVEGFTMKMVAEPTNFREKETKRVA